MMQVQRSGRPQKQFTFIIILKSFDKEISFHLKCQKGAFFVTAIGITLMKRLNKINFKNHHDEKSFERILNQSKCYDHRAPSV
jgi:hypothetical protein